ncbi:hypothetical protein DRE_01553 [Drechslerella stenobrocha 248]|uniref:Subtilisin-like serine protease n=1 Tax=Drechslerella stenobrocha 248 TaxID=1043628 RepID=W7HIG0_9PEZI|nr:hypothetical protein DRE_01553 [Drechslerella stenobrocha 248]
MDIYQVLVEQLRQRELNFELRTRIVGSIRVLERTDNFSTTPPGEPLLELAGGDFLNHLRGIYLTPELDRMSPYFRFIVTPDSSRIFPIHFQSARGRRVLANERHNLHLVWYRDRIFVKPIAPYLLSAAFWEWIAEADPEVFKAAAGLMRTYTFLIRSEADYRLAINDESPLLPLSMEKSAAGFEQFVRFTNQFARLSDDEVSPRYSYGELRLSRLNWLVRLLFIKPTFFHIHGEWGPIFMEMLAPLIATFAVLSILLTAMQVGLAVQSLPDTEHWQTYISVCNWFSVIVLSATTAACVGLVAVIAGVLIHEQVFAYSKYHAPKGNNMKTGVA